MSDNNSRRHKSFKMACLCAIRRFIGYASSSVLFGLKVAIYSSKKEKKKGMKPPEKNRPQKIKGY